MTSHKPWVWLLGLSLVGCGQREQINIERNVQEPSPPDIEATVVPENGPKLADELAAKQSELQAGMTADVKAKLEAALQQLTASGIADQALKVGDAMPEFTLVSAAGESVKSADLLAQGPVVITFHRGGWCPYCNLTLRAYQRSESDLSGAGATLVAIAPEPVDKAKTTQADTGVSYLLLSDPGCAVAKSFGVAYELDPAVRETYQQLKLDVGERNGDGSWLLPLPATYVVDRAGKIAWASIETDCTHRAEPADLVAAVKALSPSTDPTADIATDAVSLENLDRPLSAPPAQDPGAPVEAEPGKTP